MGVHNMFQCSFRPGLRFVIVLNLYFLATEILRIAVKILFGAILLYNER